ncbi:TIGR03619 family F420-dependent LLM class oxidoreductase [Lentzea sp. NBRC 102530]|uniref:TIGR03619 family F420-dependent LLM class oxidoreductase n=1 Tax=Lentzea sp. NBRC 102530 TaxID=3032201 RepID=UPI0024A27B91|nr:TIGR03619 family F420-dependent LLM class oxidoreductase [Lentzea sp. NBRC 102530]GLY53949.1 LLM class F420-dependent oxidoreductase [Lentzea sp. NBRC 102530]
MVALIMDFGVQGLNIGDEAGPQATRRLAQLAESLGYRSWWASDHVVLPSPRVDPSPSEPDTVIVDPLTHLSYVAAVTSTLELATGIVILPQRNPLVLAKQVASLDLLSGGRFTLGVGAGYLEPEMTAVGASFGERGAITDEYLDAMDQLWHADVPAFAGEHVSFSGVDAFPKPSNVRVVVGGHSPSAFRRAVTRAQGWFGIGTPSDIRGHLARFPARPDGFRISVSTQVPLTAAVVREYEDLGVDELVIYPPAFDGTVDEVLRRYAELIG